MLNFVRQRYYRLLAKRHYVALSPSTVLLGKPIFRGRPDARIVVGERSVLVSDARMTSLGVSRPTIIRALRSGASIQIGADVGISGATICAATQVVVGDRVLLGADVIIADTDFHPVHIAPEDRRYAAETAASAKPVVVEDDAFIGARSVLLKGVRVGRGAVVGAGSVVTRDVPELAIVAGNPARQIGTVTPLRPDDNGS